MAQVDKKYLDLAGLSHLVSLLKSDNYGTAVAASLVKVGRDAKGYVVLGDAVQKSDITALGIPGSDTNDNQKIKAGNVTFGVNDVVDIVAGDNISVTGASSGSGAPKITIAYTGVATDHNQLVKSGSVTFGADDTVNIKADTTTGNPITVTGNATNKEITIKHGTTTAAGAAAVKVGKDSWGHVVLGSALDYTTDLLNIPTLGTAAAKDYTTSVTQNSSDLVTSGAVWTAIDNLPEAMVFKGSVGTGGTVTWANLPAAAAANEGYTYKVITAHSAETGKPAAKVGDTIISNGSEWVVIPSGDEPSGTVTSVGLSLPSNEFTISGSPVTSSGTLTGSWKSQNANKVLAGPASGSAAAPSFRKLVAADLSGVENASDGAHTHDLSGSVSVPTVSSGTTKLYIDKGTDNAYVQNVKTDYSVTTSKLATTTLTKSTASKATAGTAVVYGTADVGSSVSIIPAVSNGKASKATAGDPITYGTANVGTSTSVAYELKSGTGYTDTFLTGASATTTAVKAEYDSDNQMLVLSTGAVTITPTTAKVGLNTKNITPAVASSATFTPYTFADVDVAKAGTAVSFTPATAADNTRKITPYTFESVNVASINSNTTVATGQLSTTGGADVAIGVTSGHNYDVLLSTAKVGSGTTGDVTVISSVDVGSTTASISGTATSAGAHSHTIQNKA